MIASHDTNGLESLPQAHICKEVDTNITHGGVRQRWPPSCDTRTPRKHAFSPGGHLDFESAVTAAQNHEFKGSCHSSYSRM